MPGFCLIAARCFKIIQKTKRTITCEFYVRKVTLIFFVKAVFAKILFYLIINNVQNEVLRGNVEADKAGVT